MSGAEIKKRILSSGLKLWQVAEKFGYTDSTFSKKLRHQFSDSDTARLLQIIEELKKAPAE